MIVLSRPGVGDDVGNGGYPGYPAGRSWTGRCKALTVEALRPMTRVCAPQRQIMTGVTGELVAQARRASMRPVLPEPLGADRVRALAAYLGQPLGTLRPRTA